MDDQQRGERLMTAENLPFILLAAALGLLGLGGFVLWLDTARTDLERRVAIISDADVGDVVTSGGSRSPADWVLNWLRLLGEQIRRRTKIFSEQEIADFERSVAAAGFNPKGFVPALLATKMLMMVLAPLIT